MKYFSILLAFLCIPTLHIQAQTSLYGKVSDKETGEELIAANVQILKGDVLFTGVTTDFEGNYSLNIDPGTYDISVSYVGYETSKIKDVIVKAGQKNKLDLSLSTSGAMSLDEIVVVDYKVPTVEHDNVTAGAIITSKDIRTFAAKKKPAIKAESSSKSYRSITAVESSIKKRPSPLSTKTTSVPPPPSVEEESAGQLTAGEWKDLDNWTFWEKLMKNETFAKYQSHWNYFPEQRFSVKVADEQGRALANVPIQLLNQDGNVVWETKSDNQGAAVLWGNFFGAKDSDFKIKIQDGQYNETFSAMNYTEGINSLTLPLDCTASKDVDLVFVVDVTGSMGDELKYLKAEASDVIQRAEEEVGVNLRTGAVFYTDRTEANTLRNIGFSDNEKETIDFMKSQKLGSGGDYPEAVDIGLGHAINEMDWNEDAIARIVFLVLDAPPHHIEEEMKSLEKSIKLAAAKGIKIIPVASSGVNKETEFLLKFFAMATNGTYTFLTDDSGIGNPHIKPEAGDYNIETLNDLMVRLIGENSEYHDCAPMDDFVAKTVTQTKLTKRERKNDDIKQFIKELKCYPNPATSHVFINMEKAIDLLWITDASAKTIQRIPKIKAGQVKISTNNWASGMYFFHFYQDGKHVVEKISVVRDS